MNRKINQNNGAHGAVSSCLPALTPRVGRKPSEKRSEAATAQNSDLSRRYYRRSWHMILLDIYVPVGPRSGRIKNPSERLSGGLIGMSNANINNERSE
jgi:hypothetical protein